MRRREVGLVLVERRRRWGGRLKFFAWIAGGLGVGIEFLCRTLDFSLMAEAEAERQGSGAVVVVFHGRCNAMREVR